MIYQLGKYMKALDPMPSSSGKTKIWPIVSVRGSPLGAVAWWSAWRRYSFMPHGKTVFSDDCMVELSNFCILQTQEHRRKV